MVDKQQLAAMGEHMREMEECKPEFKVPDGWKLVPVEPNHGMIVATAGVRVKLELFVVFGHWLPPSVRQVYRTITDL